MTEKILLVCCWTEIH